MDHPSIVFAYARGVVACHLADAYQPVMDSRLMETVDERPGELVTTGDSVSTKQIEAVLRKNWIKPCLSRALIDMR